MAQKTYYVDSCIWLNLFKNEGDESKGTPYWKIAQDFLEKIMFSEHEIVYSGFVLKEIKHKLDDDKLFKDRHDFMKQEPKFSFVKALDEDYQFARKLESEFNFEISFFDCQHVAICKRLNCILVTRDNKLIEAARRYIESDKPENLFS